MPMQPAVLQSNFLNRCSPPFLTSSFAKNNANSRSSSLPSVKFTARPPQATFSFNKNNVDSSPTSTTTILPPGPWELPVIGNIHQLLGDLPHRRLTNLAEAHGPVMKFQLGEVSAVVISSVEAAKEVFRVQDVIFADRPSSLMTDIVLYNRQSIGFGSYGDHWRQMRNICALELLSLKRVQSFEAVRKDEVSDFVQHLNLRAETPVNLTHDLFTLGNSVMLRTSIGKKIRSQEALLRVIEGIFEGEYGFTVSDLFPSFKFLHAISGDKLKLEALHRDADAILEEIISDRRATGKIVDGGQREAENLLDILLELQENGDLQFPLTNDRIKAVILDMFTGGSDTSAKTAEWALSELMRSPETMKTAQEEVRTVFGESGNVDESRLHELKFLKLVIKETLRLHPVLPLIPRECRKRTKINGYDINPKTKVLVNIWAMSRDPKIWNEAEKFKPERFQDSSIDYKGNHMEFAPFGSGKRICPGMALGITNLEFILANLLYHFDWKLPDGITPETLDMTESVGLTVRRRTDLHLIPVPYLPSHAN